MKSSIFSFFILLLSLLVNGQTPAGRVSFIVGTVEIKRAGTNEWVGAKIKLPINLNDAVRTAKESRCEITLIEDRVIRFAENSNALITNNGEANTQLKTSKGSVWVNVKKLANRPNSFEVSTSVATAAIRGTIFDVNCDSIKANVQVFRGTVATTSEFKKSGVKQVSNVINAGEECTLVSDFNTYLKDQEAAFKNFEKEQEDALEKYQKEQDAALEEYQAEQENGVKALIDAERKAFTQLGNGAAVVQRKINQEKVDKSEWAQWNKMMDQKLGW